MYLQNPYSNITFIEQNIMMFNNVFINKQRHFKKCYLHQTVFISIIVGQIIQTDKYTVFKQDLYQNADVSEASLYTVPYYLFDLLNSMFKNLRTHHRYFLFKIIFW